jgi:Flp pilus assembly protein TadD
VSDDFVQQGKVLLQRREFAEVVRVCRAGLLSKPAVVDGRLLLGTALLALRRYDEVLAEMRVAREIGADHKLVHLLTGEALFKKGDARAAVEPLARAVELDPENRVARKLLSSSPTRARGRA